MIAGSVTARPAVAGRYVRASAGLELPAPPGVFGRLCARVVGVGRRVWIRIRRKSCGHGCAVPSGTCALTRASRALSKRAAASTAGRSCGDGGPRPPVWGRVRCFRARSPYSARHGRAAGVATGRAKIAGEVPPSVIGASQATARSPPYPDPKHVTLRSQPVEGAIPNRWRANPVIKRPYGPCAPWILTSILL